MLLLLLLLLVLVMRRVMSVDVVARVLLLPLGASVLKPDLDLRLAEPERQSQTQALADRQVAGQAELRLEGGELIVAERGAGAPAAGPAADVVVAGARSATVVVARVCPYFPAVIKLHTCCTVCTEDLLWLSRSQLSPPTRTVQYCLLDYQ